MTSDTIARVADLPCFPQRSTGCLDATHKLLLLQLALLASADRCIRLEHESARLLRIQTALPAPRFLAALRRLESGGFIEVIGEPHTDRFTVLILATF